MSAIQSVESTYMAVGGIVQNASSQHFKDVCIQSVQSTYVALSVTKWNE